MDKCPNCGHWMMSYNHVTEEWECYCHTCIPQSCSCNHAIKESYDDWNARLLAQNQRGKYSVEPPSNVYPLDSIDTNGEFDRRTGGGK